MKPSHRFAPVGHGAFRVARSGVGKRLLGFLVLEGVEERDALFDAGLHLGGATRGEIHFAELVRQRSGQGIRA